MKGFKELVNKLKGIKNIEIILAVSIGLIILVIYFFPSAEENKDKNADTGITINTSSELTDEQKLKNVLSEIKGAGRIEVMITYESSPELVPAFSTDTHHQCAVGTEQYYRVTDCFKKSKSYHRQQRRRKSSAYIGGKKAGDKGGDCGCRGCCGHRS